MGLRIIKSPQGGHRSAAGPAAYRRLPAIPKILLTRNLALKTWAGITALVLILTGCVKLGPDFAEPEAPLASQWTGAENSGLKPDPAELSYWWNVFNDSELSFLVGKGYQQNLPLQAAGVRILDARAPASQSTPASTCDAFPARFRQPRRSI